MSGISVSDAVEDLSSLPLPPPPPSPPGPLTTEDSSARSPPIERDQTRTEDNKMVAATEGGFMVSTTKSLRLRLRLSH